MLDLFAGLGGWSAPWVKEGHEVVTVDMDERFQADLPFDVLTLAPRHLEIGYGPFDVVLASPPCEAFSVAAIGHHWTGGLRAYEPATAHAHTSLALVHWTLALIEATQPKFWVIENPRGMLRKLGVLDRYERVTVTYCQYLPDEPPPPMKPTDLWGGFPKAWEPRPMCANGADCHERAPRGAKTGTQGKQGAAARAEIPFELAQDIMEACVA